MDTNKMIAAAVVIVALLGGGTYLATRSDGSSESPQQTSTVNQSESQMPSERQPAPDIVELASATSDLSTLVTAVQAAGLVDTLKGSEPFTIFAPTNDAFEKLPAGTVESLLEPESKAQLQAVLTYHVVPSKVLSTDLKDGQELTTVQGGKLRVAIKNGAVTLTDATGGVSTVLKADSAADNGVVHVIDSVLLPQ